MTEPVHFEQAGHPTAPNGQCPICYSEGYEDAEKALEAEAARWRELALEFVHNRHGYCRDCGEFTGYDRVQEIQGDTPHDDDCYVGRKLADLRPGQEG